MTTVNIQTQRARLTNMNLPNHTKIRMKSNQDDPNGSNKKKIPLPPGQNRSRTESMSSHHDSVVSASARSSSARSTRSASKSISIMSKRSNASSRNSAANAKLSSSPRFLPWAFSNVSKNLVPDKYEIPDYSQSVLINKHTSSDEGSTLNNESESSWNGMGMYQNGGHHGDIDFNNYPYAGSIGSTSGSTKEKFLPMDTIHSQYTTNFDKDIPPNPPKNQLKTPVITNWKKKNKPPLHRNLHHHSRSHSADFIDVLQQQESLLSKSLISPGPHVIINSWSEESPDRKTLTTLSPPTEVDSNAESFNERDILLSRHDTEPPLHMSYRHYGAMKVDDTSQYYQYDLGRYDLYEEIDTNSSAKWVSSKVSLLDHRSATGSSGVPQRSFKRRLFLLLTEPQTSIVSAVFFALYFLLVLGSVVVMMMQTMRHFQYTPQTCSFCHDGTIDVITSSTAGTDDTFSHNDNAFLCQCPPIPMRALIVIEDYLIYFFSVEWFLRVLSYEPLKTENSDHLTFWQ